MTIDNKLQDINILNYFNDLKDKYASNRSPWEEKWNQARASYYNTPNMDKIYEGRAKIQIPIIKWKVDGISSRMNRVLFNVHPIGRIEDSKVIGVQKDVVDLWNKYIFDYQLTDIKFEEKFKTNNKDKLILGTSIAKITQEFEQKEMNLFDGENPEIVTVKDNTYYCPVLLEEFYTDTTKEDLQDSQANIHSTTISMQELKNQEKRTITEEQEIVDENTGEVLEVVNVSREIGVYDNLDLLTMNDNELTIEQTDYLQTLGYSTDGIKVVQKDLSESMKTGMIKIDECYGRYVLDENKGEEEVICTIAEGLFIIRKEPTPFLHKKYTRPFIAGKYIKVPYSFYGLSNTMIGKNLVEELNASRAQATDAKTYSIFPMMYEDMSKLVKWDKQWRPRGIIKGQGPNGISYLANPYLGNIGIQDAQIVQKDLDQLWSLAPVQEGSSDSRFIPKTASATKQIIAQNDLPLNDLINQTIDDEIKIFIEMIYERNLVFKTIEDLLSVWSEEKIAEYNKENVEMKKLFIQPIVKILGNLDLSNEIAHQAGYERYLQVAQQIPNLAMRTDWKVLGDKLLRSYGIKDDAEDIWLPEEAVQQAQQEQKEQKQLIAQATAEKENQDTQKNLMTYQAKKQIDTQADILLDKNKTVENIKEKRAELLMESATGENVN